MAYPLRPYQKEAASSVNKEWKSGHSKTLTVLPTGTGKTIVFANIVKERVQAGERVLILAHRDELLSQASDKLKKACDLETVLEKAGSTCLGSDKPVVVGSVQTLCRPSRLAKFPEDYFGTIIIDEAHHAAAASYKRVLEHFPKAKVLGVTATPDRADMQSLSDVFDSLAYQYTISQAIDDGYLCKLNTKTVPLTVDISSVRTTAGDFNAGDLGVILDKYLDKIADSLVTQCAGRKTVIFTPLVRISKKLAKLLNDRGMKTAEINGTSTDRAEILQKFEAGEYQALTNAMLLTEGWDCPSVDCVVCLRPTKSRSLYAQIVGRGTRNSPGKKNLLILDYLWLSKKHDLCHPADIICDNREVAERTTKKLQDKALAGDENTPRDGFELVMAIDEARDEMEAEKQEAMRQAEIRDAELKRRLVSMRSTVRGPVDPLQFIYSIEDAELLDYKPVLPAEKEPPHSAMLDHISSYGILAERVKSTGLALRLLNTLETRHREGKSTPKQIRWLERQGFLHVGTWTKSYASSMLSVISDNNWEMPDYFDASVWDWTKQTSDDLKKIYDIQRKPPEPIPLPKPRTQKSSASSPAPRYPSETTSKPKVAAYDKPSYASRPSTPSPVPSQSARYIANSKHDVFHMSERTAEAFREYRQRQAAERAAREQAKKEKACEPIQLDMTTFMSSRRHS